MIQENPHCAIPFLPEISRAYYLRKPLPLDSPEIAEIRIQLQRFLNMITRIPTLHESVYFNKFVKVTFFDPEQLLLDQPLSSFDRKFLLNASKEMLKQD